MTESTDEHLHAIYKYEVGFGETRVPNVPLQRKVVHFGQQGERMFVWVDVNLSSFSQHQACDMRILVFGTGDTFDAGPKTDSLDHVGTLQSGPFVWHAFVKKGAW